ncbi:MAG: hypothetical protein DLM58_09680 [Pseudonocardiales bacterium]|nr:MAG: hypothetical protein DLM58_09680 [Pseudonocardiales bacterium]
MGGARKFGVIVAASGGARRVADTGFGLDFAFIAVFAAIAPALLYAGHRWWPVPIVAAGLDVTEDVGASFS